jgi:hypothetical protein
MRKLQRAICMILCAMLCITGCKECDACLECITFEEDYEEDDYGYSEQEDFSGYENHHS